MQTLKTSVFGVGRTHWTAEIELLLEDVQSCEYESKLAQAQMGAMKIVASRYSGEPVYPRLVSEIAQVGDIVNRHDKQRGIAAAMAQLLTEASLGSPRASLADVQDCVSFLQKVAEVVLDMPDDPKEAQDVDNAADDAEAFLDSFIDRVAEMIGDTADEAQQMVLRERAEAILGEALVASDQAAASILDAAIQKAEASTKGSKPKTVRAAVDTAIVCTLAAAADTYLAAFDAFIDEATAAAGDEGHPVGGEGKNQAA
jgi:hypothetical protein